MFAGQHAADFDAQAQDVVAEFLGAVEFARHVGIVEDQRVQVAIARMEHVGDAEAVLGRKLFHPPQHVRQLAARDGAVHAIVIGRDAPDGGKGRLSSRPEGHALAFILRDAIGGCPVLGGDARDFADQVVAFGGGAIDLDNQQRADIERVADLDEGFGGVDRGAVHHLHAGGDDPFADDLRHAGAGAFGIGEADQHRARGFGFGQDAHGHFGDDAEQPFGADHHAQQVQPCRIKMPPAEAYDLAIHQHQFDAQHVVRGEAVFQAVYAARVFRDVAADRTGDLAGRIGRVVEPAPLDRLRDGEVGDAGLHHGDAVLVVDVEHALELAHAQQHRIGQRKRSARKRGARPTRYDLDALGMAPAQHGGNLFHRFGQHHQHRRLAIGGEPVRFPRTQRVGLRDHAFAGHDRLHRGDDAVALGERALVGRGHGDGHGVPSLCRAPGRPTFGPCGPAKRAFLCSGAHVLKYAALRCSKITLFGST